MKKEDDIMQIVDCNIQCDDHETVMFINSIIEIGLLNIQQDKKEKFKDLKIKLNFKLSDEVDI
jgi:hypothetical protein